MAEYIVKKGDTLNKIAQAAGFENYKKAGITSVPSGNFDLIRPGEKITIGAAAPSTQKTSSTTAGGAPIDLSGIKTGLENVKAGLATLGTAGTPPAPGAVTSTSDQAAAYEAGMKSSIDSLRGSMGLDTYDKFLANQVNPLQKSTQEQQALIEQQRANLAARRAGAISDITSGFEAQRQQTEFAQKRDTGATSMFLAGAGGYLGQTGGYQGVLETQAVQQRQELSNLEAQKQAAINQANAAYEDRDFELASKSLEVAQNMEKEITNRTNDFYTMSLNVMQEARAQQGDIRAQREFGIKQANDQVDRFISAGVTPTAKDIQEMAQLSGNTPTQLSKLFEGAANSRALQEEKDRTTMGVALVNALADVPNTQTVTINGKTYRGLKDPYAAASAAITASERLKAQDISVKREMMADIAKGATLNDLVLAYPEIDATEIDKTMQILALAPGERSKRAEVMSGLEAGTLNIAQPEFSGDKPVVYDSTKYEAAVKAWATGGEFFTNDTEIVVNGKTYKGPAGTIPNPRNFALPEIAAGKDVKGAY